MNVHTLKSSLVAVLAVGTLSPLAALAQGRSAEAEQALAESKQMLGVTLDMVKDMPDDGLAPFWEQMKGLQLNPHTALSGKTKELIGLGVAAQIPCRYCVYAHTVFAKLNGATDRDIKEAIATAGLARELSALSHGQSPDQKTKAEASAQHESTFQEIQKAFGGTPEFFKRYPVSALVPLWGQVKGVLLNGSTGISVKEKALLSLAVASQLPSDSCVKDYTAMARGNGATEQEIQEAVAMAGFTRSASTILNGSLTDEVAWRHQVDQVAKFVSKPKVSAR
jgi:AhpD family alkylhydroperoxidase